jgi:hypothetical protein
LHRPAEHGTVCSQWVRILKTRLKVTSVFMAIWPHPHAFNTRPVQQQNASILLYASSKVATNAAPHPKDCTMIDVHVEMRDKKRS